MTEGAAVLVVTPRELVFPELSGVDAVSTLEQLAREIARALPSVDEKALAMALIERERLGSTAVGGGIAIPHCRIRGAGSGHLAVGRHPADVPFEALDGRPVQLFFVVVAPLDSPAEHLRLLAAAARLARRAGLLDRVRAAEGVEGVVEAVGLEDRSSAA